MKRYCGSLIFTLFLSGVAFAQGDIHREILNSPSSSKKIEMIWSQPPGTGPWPSLILVHPHQEWPDQIGAEIFVKNGTLGYWVEKGFIAAAVSQPGYGNSDGPKDFCGPSSQQAVLEAVRHFRNMPSIDKDAIFLYGGSRGASIAAIVAAKDNHLAGAVLKSGLYDFVSAYKNYPWYSLIKLNMIWELGWNNEEALRERSAIFYADQIKVPLLIIHGTNDDRAGIEYAQSFMQKVNEAGGSAKFVSLESEHVIPMAKINPMMESFFKEHIHQ